MFNNIMVPLDGSRLGSQALRYAVDIARRYNARIVLARAVQPAAIVPSSDAAYGIASPTVAEITVEQAQRQDKRNEALAKRYLNQRLRKIRSQGIEADARIVTGDAADSIMKICKREKIDLVVMTTHGRSGLRRAILGSVADKVIRESGEPVLVIRPGQRRKK